MTRLTHSEMAHQMGLMAAGKAHWLTNFADGRNKRPDGEILAKRLDLKVLQQAQADYQAAAEREGQV